MGKTSDIAGSLCARGRKSGWEPEAFLAQCVRVSCPVHEKLLRCEEHGPLNI